jgi:PAS domain-containing protein
VEKAMEAGTPYQLELELIRPDGTIRLVNAFGGITYDMHGRIKGLHGTLQDITELKQTEELLNATEGRYRSLFNNMVEGFAYCKMLFENDKPVDFIYLEVNDAFNYMTGLKDVAGRKVSEIIPGIQEVDPEL